MLENAKEAPKIDIPIRTVCVNNSSSLDHLVAIVIDVELGRWSKVHANVWWLNMMRLSVLDVKNFKCTNGVWELELIVIFQ